MIEKKFLCYQTKKEFQKDLSAGNIKETSIVFVLDEGFIYTHGVTFIDPGVQEVLTHAIGFLEDRITENEKVLGQALNNITINGQLLSEGNIQITKESIGLSNVDNTSDKSKPVSDATKTELGKKVDKVSGSSLVADSKIISYDNHLTNTSNPHGVTKAQVGLGNVDNTSDANKPISTATQEALEGKVDKEDGKALVETSKITSYDNHISNKNNPHSVTKAQLGLGNVDNTSDANKPISTATQNALNLKANSSDLTSHIGNKNNPHSVTKAQLGLGNVDNTSDLNKPISKETEEAFGISVAAMGDFEDRLDTIEKTLGATINELRSEIEKLKIEND